MNPAVAAMALANRLYPPARVGDRFGDREIVEVVPRAGRHRPDDERVRWRCVCGKTGETFTYNLRRAPTRCAHRRLRVVVLDVCACGEHLDDHLPRGGACLEDDCDCQAFRGEATA